MFSTDPLASGQWKTRIQILNYHVKCHVMMRTWISRSWTLRGFCGKPKGFEACSRGDYIQWLLKLLDCTYSRLSFHASNSFGLLHKPESVPQAWPLGEACRKVEGQGQSLWYTFRLMQQSEGIWGHLRAGKGEGSSKDSILRALAPSAASGRFRWPHLIIMWHFTWFHNP